MPPFFTGCYKSIFKLARMPCIASVGKGQLGRAPNGGGLPHRCVNYRQIAGTIDAGSGEMVRSGHSTSAVGWQKTLGEGKHSSGCVRVEQTCCSKRCHKRWRVWHCLPAGPGWVGWCPGHAHCAQLWQQQHAKLVTCGTTRQCCTRGWLLLYTSSCRLAGCLVRARCATACDAVHHLGRTTPSQTACRSEGVPSASLRQARFAGLMKQLRRRLGPRSAGWRERAHCLFVPAAAGRL